MFEGSNSLMGWSAMRVIFPQISFGIESIEFR